MRNAYEHWKKHGTEFPEYGNAIDYVKGAHRFTKSPPGGTYEKVKPNGDKMLYDPTINTFAVVDASGAPKTMFRPSAEIKYWDRQSNR